MMFAIMHFDYYFHCYYYHYYFNLDFNYLHWLIAIIIPVVK